MFRNLLTVAFVLSVIFQVRAQTARQTEPPSDSRHTPAKTAQIGVDVTDPLPLSVQEAISLALENNNDLKAVETNVRIAEFDLRQGRAAFDPVLAGESYYERTTRPTASALESVTGSVKQTGFVNNFGVRGFVPRFGGSYEANFNVQRNRTNAAFAGLNPQIPSAFSFTFTQPLLRGLRTDENRRRIQIAKRNISLSDAQFRQRAIETVAAVETAYWDLTFALKNLQVQRDAVQQADAQLKSNRRQVEQGVLAPVDILQAETQVANFQQALFAAEEAVAATENNLKALILPAPADSRWTQPFIPTTIPDRAVPPVISLDAAVASALKNRPELAQLTASRDINRINQRFAREQTRPRVDIVAAYSAAGLAGKPDIDPNGTTVFGGGDEALRERVNQLSALNNLPQLPPPVVVPQTIPDSFVGGYGRSLGNLFANRFPAYRIGVRIELPFGNRAAKAELGRTLAEGTRIDYETRQAEQNIVAQIRTALQSVASGDNRLRAATEARITAEKQYASEQRQLLNGISTTFLVLERQTAFVAAQGREVQAQTDLNKATANLNRALGTTLESNQISLREKE